MLKGKRALERCRPKEMTVFGTAKTAVKILNECFKIPEQSLCASLGDQLM
jgi:hypothetical protein